VGLVWIVGSIWEEKDKRSSTRMIGVIFHRFLRLVFRALSLMKVVGGVVSRRKRGDWKVHFLCLRGMSVVGCDKILLEE